MHAHVVALLHILMGFLMLLYLVTLWMNFFSS